MRHVAQGRLGREMTMTITLAGACAVVFLACVANETLSQWVSIKYAALALSIIFWFAGA